ncbi:MAG: cell division protein SepF [Eubacteriales bacterium]|nr:cell division protein SepF [Eubacteriales bacterium]
MSFLDKILNAMKLNDDYDDEDFLEDELDVYEADRPKRSLFKKSSSIKNDYDDFDEDEDEPIVRKAPRQTAKTVKAPASMKPRAASAAATSSKVSPIRTRKNVNDMQVCVIKPRSMEDAREITETLLSNCTVLLNLEGQDVELSQRIIDFTSGSCYAMSGNLQKISNYIFIITPASVDVSGDFQDILSGAFDVPPMNFDY